MHLSKTFCFRVAILIFSSITTVQAVSSNTSYTPSGFVTTSTILQLANLLPPTSIFDHLSCAQWELAENAKRAKAVLDWCKQQVESGHLLERELSWTPELSPIFLELNSLCSELKPLAHVETLVDVRLARQEVELANRTLSEYRNTGKLAAEDVLTLHQNELKHLGDSLSSGRDMHDRLDGVHESIDHMLSRLWRKCSTGTGEQCWSTEYHLKLSINQADGTWSTHDYEQTLRRQMSRFDRSVWQRVFSFESERWNCATSEQLTSIEKELHSRAHNVSKVLEMDFNDLDPQPIVELLIDTVKRGVQQETIQQETVQQETADRDDSDGWSSWMAWH